MLLLIKKYQTATQCAVGVGLVCHLNAGGHFLNKRVDLLAEIIM